MRIGLATKQLESSEKEARQREMKEKKAHQKRLVASKTEQYSYAMLVQSFDLRVKTSCHYASNANQLDSQAACRELEQIIKT